MLKVKSTTLRRFGGFTIKFYFVHCSIPPPNFDTSAICGVSAETLIQKAYTYVKFSTYGKNGRWHYLPFILFHFFLLSIQLFGTLISMVYIYVCDLANDRKFWSRSHKKWFDLVLRSFKKIIWNNSFWSQKNILNIMIWSKIYSFSDALKIPS